MYFVQRGKPIASFQTETDRPSGGSTPFPHITVVVQIVFFVIVGGILCFIFIYRLLCPSLFMPLCQCGRLILESYSTRSVGRGRNLLHNWLPDKFLDIPPDFHQEDRTSLVHPAPCPRTGEARKVAKT